MPPTVRALQYIFTTEVLNEKVFKLLEEKIFSNKKKTGRKGMDLWHILVLAVVRHATGTNWDRLHLMANGDRFVRKIMRIHSTRFGMEEIEFDYQNILDNVSLTDEELLYQINTIVVEAGHQLLKKKENQVVELQLKTDNYAVETNVHFHTDLNLLWDSLRKCLDTVEKLQALTPVKGWRKIKYIRKTLKSQFRRTLHQVFKGKSAQAKKQSVQQYLYQTRLPEASVAVLIKHPPVSISKEQKVMSIIVLLEKYKKYVPKFTDKIEHRLLKEEVIPAAEKIFSIFEEHTGWITKGKQNKRVELGHLLLITSDQHQFIIDYKIMEGQKDASQVKPLTERLEKNVPVKK